MKRDLHFAAVYNHPIEKVWKAISDPAAIAQWLMPNDFAPRVGHKFQFKSKPQPGWNGITDCEVLECVPPRRLVYAWRSGTLDTVLTLELESTAAGTRLTLAHTGFRGLKARLVSTMMGKGWRGIVDTKIPAVLDRMGEHGNLAPPQDRANSHARTPPGQ